MRQLEETALRDTTGTENGDVKDQCGGTLHSSCGKLNLSIMLSQINQEVIEFN